MALLAGLLSAAPLASAEQLRILVVTSSAVLAYRDALDGFTEAMEAGPSELFTVDLSDGEQQKRLPALIAGMKPRVVIAIGSQAAELLASAPAAVIATMILDSDRRAASGGNLLATVSLEVSFATVLVEVKHVVPGTTRVGILRDPARGGPSQAELGAQAKRQGFTLEFANSRGPQDLLESFVSLSDRVDFVWCPPDSSLFNPTTVQPLVMASLRHRLPIIGFSESFVRAGAAVGVYPDFRDIGAQTAALTQRVLASQPAAPRETPRTVKVAVNQRIMRLFGLSYSQSAVADGRILVIR
jgi:putative tryptophan/tyrosine transport system substrate-binding protein